MLYREKRTQQRSQERTSAQEASGSAGGVINVTDNGVTRPLDMEALKKIGPVIELTTEDIFGY